MIVGVAGAGAVGCHYGIRLQLAGCEVRFLARGAHLLQLQQQGLKYVSMGESSCLPVQASDDPAMLAGCDVVLMTCKTTTLAGMCALLAPHVKQDALLVTMQNGVTAPAEVAASFPEHPVLAASAFIGARIESPGKVVHSAAGHVRLGAWQGGSYGDAGSRIEALLACWQQAGVDARLVEDARVMLWHKLLWNCGFNAITALTRRYAREIAMRPDTLALVKQAMQETVAVAKAEGVLLDAAAMAQHIELTMKGGEVKTSMWQDIEHGHKTEIEAMNGHVAMRGEALGVDTPVNRMLTALIHAAEVQS